MLLNSHHWKGSECASSKAACVNRDTLACLVLFRRISMQKEDAGTASRVPWSVIVPRAMSGLNRTFRFSRARDSEACSSEVIEKYTV